MAATSLPLPPRPAPAAKRPRTWDVDVSLDELVQWDVLEQFMQDIPTESSIAEHGLCDALLSSFGRGAAEGAPSGSCSLMPGACSSVLGSGIGSNINNASLSHSLTSCWSQPSAGLSAHMLGQSWGADFGSGLLLSSGEKDICMSGSSADHEGVATAGADGSRQVHKQRFVWTADLHRRFEAAVNTLGIDQAKPQAISQLMNCEGEGAPTRQNIKSHLQKYRLLMQKRGKAGSGGSMTMTPSASCASLVDQDEPVTDDGDVNSHSASKGDARCAASRLERSSGSSGTEKPGYTMAAPSAALKSAGSSDKTNTASACLANSEKVGVIPKASPTSVQSELELHLARQEMNLKVQMDLQTKLHRQLLMQRQLQHQLETSFGGDGASDPQRWQSTLSLKNSLRERLTKHVAMQQEMLQHLDALVSSEVTKLTSEKRDESTGRKIDLSALGGDGDAGHRLTQRTFSVKEDTVL